MQTNTPAFLAAGATIGITCPSGYVAQDRIEYAVTTLSKWGFKVVIGKTVGNGSNYFAGTDQERLQDLQQMLNDDNIDAILMGRGGYGVTRIIDQIDFTRFVKKPKWICGFSDITVLHNHIHARYGIPTLHSPMCGAFSPETELATHIVAIKHALTGKFISYTTPASLYNRAGDIEGIITGGNLAILAHLTGSASEVNTDGKILLIEDIGEHLYNIDRLMLNLKRSGKLSKLSALLVGSFTDMEDTTRPFGKTLEQIIKDNVEEYQYPVCFNFPCGHQEINFPVQLGVKHTLSVSENGGIITNLNLTT